MGYGRFIRVVRAIMNNKVTIEKIVLKVRNKEISLSLAEAQELKKILDELFKVEVVQSAPIVIERPIWIQPYNAPSTPMPPYNPWFPQVWCGNMDDIEKVGSTLYLTAQ